MATILNDGGDVHVIPAAPSEVYSEALITLTDGTFIHLFEGFGAADSYGIYGQRYDGVGVAVGQPFLINTTTTDFQTDCLGAALEGGGFVVVWNDYSLGTTAPDVIAQRFDAAGQKVGGEVRVNTFTTNSQLYPSVAGLTDGGYVITWQSFTQDGDRYGIYSQRFDASGVAVGGEVHVSTYTALSQVDVDITALSNGGYVISWASNGQDGDSFGIYAQRFDAAGTAVGGEVRVNTDTAGRQHNSKVTALADGGYVIVWQGPGVFEDGGIYFQRFDAAGAPMGDQTLVNSDTVSVHEFPHIQGLSDGGFAIAWVHEQASSAPGATNPLNEIDVQRYDASGRALGEVLIVTLNAGENPDLAIGELADGGFTVGWSGYDGNQWQTYQRVYRATTGNDSGDHLIYGTNGDDVLAGTQGYDRIFGGDGHDVITALDAGGTQGGGDELYAGAGDDVLTGSIGHNALDGGMGADSMAGGTGNDTYYVDNAGDTVVEAVNSGIDTVYASLSYVLAAGQHVENLVLTGKDYFNLTGNAFANTLTGNIGNNVLDGGAGNDTLAGGGGNDSYMVDTTLDVVIEAVTAGFDQVTALVDYSLTANVETLVLGGTAALSGGGNDQANTLIGNSAANLLLGRGGNDRLDGGAGKDTMVGGFGDDTFVVDNPLEKVVEFNNQGTDWIEASTSYALTGLYVENLIAAGSDNFTLGGNSFANELIGNIGNNTLNVGLNADRMAGGIGNDLYFVDHVGDVVIELANQGKDAVNASITYTLTDNVETLALIGYQAINGAGNALDNTVTGNGNANQLNGGDGKDLLIGQGGNDILTGGAGADSFRFYRAGALNGLDHLTDFVSGTDKLQLTGADYGFAKGQVLTAAELHTGGSVGAFGQFLYNIVNHTLYWDADGTGATAAVALAVFDNAASPVAGDFVFL